MLALWGVCMSGSERDGIEVVSDGGLRVMESHLRKSMARLGKVFERMETHGVDEGMGDGDFEWHVSAAYGQVNMALHRIDEERESRQLHTGNSRGAGHE